MKRYSVLACVLICLFASENLVAQKNINGLVEAEKAFASFTSSHSIRDGFLKFMDSTGIVFRQGNSYNALEAYQKQKSGPAILNWQPAFAVISGSGDFGVTTGPYQLRANATDTNIYRGSFSSIWKMNAQGEWKNIIDLGTQYTKKEPEIKHVNEMVLKTTVSSSASFSDITDLDTKFNQAVTAKNAGTLATFLSADSWLNAEGELPVTGVEPVRNILLHIPDAVSFTTQAGSIATSKDLAYVYGTVTNGARKDNYLRVWALRNKQWQVIMQTIKW